MRLCRFAMVAILATSSLVSAQEKTGSNKRYIKNEQAAVVNAGKSGQTIGLLARGTELLVEEETDTMAKVQITAWIAKAELATSRPLRALHIAVKTRAQADSIIMELKAGKDFVELARTKSILPNAAKGGDLGYFSHGDFDPKIEALIAGLDLNQVSEVLETSFGFNLFKRIQ